MRIINSFIGLILSLLFFWLIMHSAMVDFKFRKNAIKTNATVVKVQSEFVDRPYIIYQFQHQGKIIRVTKTIRQRQQIFGGVQRYLNTLRPNDKIAIGYLANDPQHTSRVMHFMNKTITNLGLIIGIFFFILLFSHDIYRKCDMWKK